MSTASSSPLPAADTTRCCLFVWLFRFDSIRFDSVRHITSRHVTMHLSFAVKFALALSLASLTGVSVRSRSVAAIESESPVVASLALVWDTAIRVSQDSSPPHVVFLRNVALQSCPLIRPIEGHRCRVNRKAASAVLDRCSSDLPAESKDEAEEMQSQVESTVESPIESESKSSETAAEPFKTDADCSQSLVVLLRNIATQL